MDQKVYIETYGCALNWADTGIMVSVLRQNGYKIVESIDEADVIIINTCTVRLDSEERMRRRITTLYQYSVDTSKTLVVAGCMASAQPFTVKRLAPAAVLVSTANVHYIDEAIRHKKDLLEFPEKPKTLYLSDENSIQRGFVAEVAIADGCLGDCGFCITKLARRRVYSRPLEQVVRLVESLARRGVKEIRLTGQDVAVYGIDIYGRRMLPQLLEKLSDLEGDFMIRVGMMGPEQLAPILDEFLEAATSPRIFKFFHLPVQSGDDNVLKLMKRGYTVDEYKALVKEIRRKIPGALIATDIIIGYPGEDDEAFENTVKLVEELRFERVHVARYTPRPRTIAAGLKQVPDAVKKERSKKLISVVERIGYEEHAKLVGSRAHVLVVSKGERGGLEAKMFNYMPVILPENSSSLGVWRCAEVVEATWYDLRGRVVEC